MLSLMINEVMQNPAKQLPARLSHEQSEIAGRRMRFSDIPATEIAELVSNLFHPAQVERNLS